MSREKEELYHKISKMLYYNKCTGDLTWKEGCGSRYSGKVAGYVHEPRGGHLKIKHKNKRYFCHILCWIIHTGKFPEGQIDHINGNPSDNSWKNLRCVTASINLRNAPRKRKNHIPYAGVRRVKSRWNVDCCGERLGSFNCLGEAVRVRKNKEDELGGFTERHSIR